MRAMPTNLKEKLARRYRTAKVLQFSSPMGGDWLRIRVAEDDKKRAQEVMRETHTDAGVYLVRLDYYSEIPGDKRRAMLYHFH